MTPEFYPDSPAILIERGQRTLVMADPHFGIEAYLHRRGLHFRSATASRLARLLVIIDESNPDYLAVLGDLKHVIPYVTYQEKCEVPDILQKIREKPSSNSPLVTMMQALNTI
ncbi:MAG: hypothetical protein LBU24_02690 [Methanocalculaceae archaeon]|nr:hypothetical protein [Methanocalculaceae archaeon]